MTPRTPFAREFNSRQWLAAVVVPGTSVALAAEPWCGAHVGYLGWR